MKKIEAAIKPYKLVPVAEALSDIGVSGLTITEVLGCGRQQEWPEDSWKDPNDPAPVIWLEVVVSDDVTEQTVNSIIKAARTGRQGDGKVFVSAIIEAYSIRNGEKGEAAVTNGRS